MKEKKAPKTYKTLRALLAAKSKGTLPRGTLVRVGINLVEWIASGTIIYSMSISGYAEACAKGQGFRVAG